MQDKIVLEEHFAIPETLKDSAGFVPGDDWIELRGRLLDIQDRRLREMDAHGVAQMVLSLNAPAIQAIPDRRTAIDLARRANDFLGRRDRQAARPLPRSRRAAPCRIRRRPRRNWPVARRATLGFRGALVNGFSQVDEPGTRRLLTICRNTGRSGPRWSGWTSRSTCTRATRCRSMRRSMTAIPGCLAPPGRLRRRRRCMRCG